MVAPQVLVTLHLPPGGAERGDHRSRVRLVLVRQQQGVAAVIEAPAVTAGRREHAYSPLAIGGVGGGKRNPELLGCSWTRPHSQGRDTPAEGGAPGLTPPRGTLRAR